VTPHDYYCRTLGITHITRLKMAERDGPDRGYFNLPDGTPPSPGSIRSNDSMSIHLPSLSSDTLAALTAMQYLPIPLLVLSSEKTVCIANEAMGRLLGIAFDSTIGEGRSVTDHLHGKNMGELGIDILQNGSPILVSWEVGSLCTIR
jgi:hypothetical protein